ncbi:MAG: ROK family protein [Actinobacteria bacterium]|jgi:glucokinase|nr:ROK family protein [Actinomycetota bacterium]
MDLALSIDIGGSKIAVGLVTRNGELIDRTQFVVNAQDSSEELFDDLSRAVDAQLLRAVDHHGVRPSVVGVGSAGPITANVETISPLNIPQWRGFELRQRLETLTGLPVFGDGDAKALALAEGWLGAARGIDNFMAMVVSTGVGGGIVLNGQLLDGETGNAGHIGHVIVEPNGRRCTCGGRGCLEAEASGPAIEAITGRSPTQPTYEIMVRTGRLVGRGVASACNLLDLKLVVVGGSVALGFGATFFNAAQRTLDELCTIEFSRKARIVPTRLSDEGPLIGASAVGWRGLNRMATVRD